MTGKSEAANLACASVEDMEENPFPLLHPNRLAMTKHSSIDGEQAIAYLVALRPSSGERGLHRAFAGILQTSYCSCGREEVHIHVSTLAEGRVKFLQRQEDFTVVVARIASWFDIHRPDESTVLPSAEVASSTDMRVIEAKAKGLWNERNSAASNNLFFLGTVRLRPSQNLKRAQMSPTHLDSTNCINILSYIDVDHVITINQIIWVYDYKWRVVEGTKSVL